MIKKDFTVKNLALFLAITLGTSSVSMAQDHSVTEYTFSQEMGTYEPLDAPTYIMETTASTVDIEDLAVYTLPANTIPFNFNFNGTDYNTLNVYADGFITFGSYAADGSGWYHYKPLTDSAAPFEGVVAGFNEDLAPLKLINDNKFGKLSYQVKGESPNRSFVIQWENYTRYRWQDDYDTNRYECNFQIILNEDNTIEYKYDIGSFGYTTEDARFVTVGLRGNSTADFNTREANGTANKWETSIQGDMAASTIYLDAISMNLPASGLTFKWTPPTNGETTPTPITYCEPTFEYPNAGAEPITFVGFNTIANTTSAVYADLLPHYEDFSSISTEVVKGETYELKLKGNTIPSQNGNTNYFAVFIDWNQDGTFETSGDEYYNNLPELVNSTGTDNIEVTYNIQIPTTATNGNVRMRIIKNYSEVPTTACGVVGDYGQVEDYTLVVQSEGSGSGCTNTDPGTENGDLGCVSGTYNGNPVEYTTVRAADGNIWLQQNLGSTEVASAIDSEASYGDLFQWGRWDDGHQLRNSTVNNGTPSPDNPLGVTNTSEFYLSWWSTDPDEFDTWEAETVESSTDTDGCDPCKKALGEGWELPSQEDWATLKQAENISNKTAAFESNLKLPASGYRGYVTGNLTFVGERGYYWSKTTSTIGAKYFYISTIANPNAGGNRAQGASVRCVKKSTPAALPGYEKVKVTIYPNPTSDWIYIQADNAMKNAILFDMSGNKIKESSTKQINVANIATGVYILQIEWENGTKSSQKNYEEIIINSFN